LEIVSLGNAVFVSVDAVGPGRGAGRSERVARERVLAAARGDRLDHVRVFGREVARRLADDVAPSGEIAAGERGVRELGGGLEALDGGFGIAGEVLPRDTDDAEEEDEAGVADRAARAHLGEEGVLHEIALAVRDGGRGEGVSITLDGIEEIDAEAALLVEATEVDVVVEVGERGRAFAAWIEGAVARGLSTGLAARVAGAFRALGARAREAEALRRVVWIALLRDVEELAILLDGAVVLVAEQDDDDHGVGAEKIGPLLEQHLIFALGDGFAILDHDGLIRVGIDEEAIPALELRLVATANLTDAAHHVAQGGDEARLAREIAYRGFAGRDELLRGIPGEEALALVGGEGLSLAGLAAGEEVGSVVVAEVARSATLGLGGGAGVGAVAAQARADEADVEVAHRDELAPAAGGAGVERALGLYADGGAARVDAAGAQQAEEDVRQGLGEDLLLVVHRAGVVDDEEEIDLGGDEGRWRRGRRGAAGGGARGVAAVTAQAVDDDLPSTRGAEPREREGRREESSERNRGRAAVHGKILSSRIGRRDRKLLRGHARISCVSFGFRASGLAKGRSARGGLERDDDGDANGVGGGGANGLVLEEQAHARGGLGAHAFGARHLDALGAAARAHEELHLEAARRAAQASMLGDAFADVGRGGVEHLLDLADLAVLELGSADFHQRGQGGLGVFAGIGRRGRGVRGQVGWRRGRRLRGRREPARVALVGEEAANEAAMRVAELAVGAARERGGVGGRRPGVAGRVGVFGENVGVFRGFERKSRRRARGRHGKERLGLQWRCPDARGCAGTRGDEGEAQGARAEEAAGRSRKAHAMGIHRWRRWATFSAKGRRRGALVERRRRGVEVGRLAICRGPPRD
jgi:hypothetical protein